MGLKLLKYKSVLGSGGERGRKAAESVLVTVRRIREAVLFEKDISVLQQFV